MKRLMMRALPLTLLALALIVLARGWPWRGAENPLGVPRLLQTDYQQTLCVVKGEPRSVMSSGCGATCVAAVGEYLTGRKGPTPEDLFVWAYENGHYFGDGLGHEALAQMAELYGLSAEWIKNDAARIQGAIRSGLPVVAHMGRGTFAATSGHYILLIGETQDGLIWVHDPYKPERAEQPYELRQLLREAKTGASFMIMQGREGATRLL